MSIEIILQIIYDNDFIDIEDCIKFSRINKYFYDTYKCYIEKYYNIFKKNKIYLIKISDFHILILFFFCLIRLKRDLLIFF